MRARAANQRMDQAWALYLQTEGRESVNVFKENPGMLSFV